jgi:hypothetical protein
LAKPCLHRAFNGASDVRRQGGETLISGNIDSLSGTAGEIDAFLSDCLKAILRAAPLPAWPDRWQACESEVIDRIGFHGIAPFLNSGFSLQNPAETGWPATILQALRKETALATFWENSHRETIARLIAAFHDASVSVVITKGTALAYSVYPQPHMRRRGDSDIVVLGGTRKQARAVLAACGFTREADPRALQEDWHYDSPLGIRHAVDVHWHLNASAAISRWLGRGACFAGHIDLPQLGPGARGMGPIGNIILTAINRHSHGVMGYYVAGTRLFETGRLIWAVDLFLLTRSFIAQDWAELAEQAERTGTAAIVLSGLQYAEAMVGAQVPPSVIAALGQVVPGDDVAGYFATVSGARRLRADVAAAPRLADKGRVALRALLPSDAFLEDRFPDARGWPRSALHLRRLVEGALKSVRSKA